MDVWTDGWMGVGRSGLHACSHVATFGRYLRDYGMLITVATIIAIASCIVLIIIYIITQVVLIYDLPRSQYGRI